VDSSFYPRRQSEISQLLVELSLPEVFFFIVGTIEPRKNLELFIECYLEFCNKNNAKAIPLVISGDHGWNNRCYP
jgi:glycosyltransferase involved in cell wall biosynthesis